MRLTKFGLVMMSARARPLLYIYCIFDQLTIERSMLQVVLVACEPKSLQRTFGRRKRMKQGINIPWNSNRFVGISVWLLVWTRKNCCAFDSGGHTALCLSILNTWNHVYPCYLTLEISHHFDGCPILWDHSKLSMKGDTVHYRIVRSNGSNAWSNTHAYSVSLLLRVHGMD